jgi:hypothetical protein
MYGPSFAAPIGRVDRPRSTLTGRVAPSGETAHGAEARHGPVAEFLFDQGQFREPVYQGEDSHVSFDTRQMCSQAQSSAKTPCRPRLELA